MLPAGCERPKYKKKKTLILRGLQPSHNSGIGEMKTECLVCAALSGRSHSGIMELRRVVCMPVLVCGRCSGTVRFSPLSLFFFFTSTKKILANLHLLIKSSSLARKNISLRFKKQNKKNPNKVASQWFPLHGLHLGGPPKQINAYPRR